MVFKNIREMVERMRPCDFLLLHVICRCDSIPIILHCTLYHLPDALNCLWSATWITIWNMHRLHNAQSLQKVLGVTESFSTNPSENWFLRGIWCHFWQGICHSKQRHHHRFLTLFCFHEMNLLHCELCSASCRRKDYSDWVFGRWSQSFARTPLILRGKNDSNWKMV